VERVNKRSSRSPNKVSGDPNRQSEVTTKILVGHEIIFEDEEHLPVRVWTASPTTLRR
jgi:hypothetical protein